MSQTSHKLTAAGGQSVGLFYVWRHGSSTSRFATKKETIFLRTEVRGEISVFPTAIWYMSGHSLHQKSSPYVGMAVLFALRYENMRSVFVSDHWEIGQIGRYLCSQKNSPAFLKLFSNFFQTFSEGLTTGTSALTVSKKPEDPP